MQDAIESKINKLIEYDLIREEQRPDWLTSSDQSTHHL